MVINWNWLKNLFSFNWIEGSIERYPSPLLHEQRDKKFGPLPWTQGTGKDDSIIVSSDWIARNIVPCNLGTFGNGRCNKSAKDAFEGFFKALSAEPKLLALVDEASMYNARMMRGSTGSYPSAHAYGLAFDLRNAKTKEYTPRGSTWPEAQPIRQLAIKYGITNGSQWKNSDPAHFEFPHV